jgi:signal transduction histidine kinase
MSFRLHARVFYWNLVIIVIVVLIAQESGTRALAAIVVGILINLVLAWFIRVRISSPINEIATAIRKLAAGDLNHRLPISGEEEVVTLGTSLNAMAQNIGLMIGQLQEGKRKVESVVAAMSEGVIVLDRAGRITLTNESFRRRRESTAI